MPATAVERLETLRKWYLARLRKNALEESIGITRVTPGTLILADRDAIELLASSKTATALPPPNHPLSDFSNFRTAIAPAAVALSLILFISVATSFWGGVFYAFISGLVLFSMLLIAIVIQYEFRLRSVRSYLADNILSTNSSSSSRLPGYEDVAYQVVRENASMIERLNLIADYSAEVICLFDKELTVEAISPSVAKIWRYSPVELLGMSLDILDETLEIVDQPSLRQILLRHRDAKSDLQFERSIKGGAGKIIDTRWKVEWSDREQVYFAVIEDISAEKELERLRNEFVAVISHDLRAPVNSIKWNLNLLEGNLYGDINELGSRRIRESLESADFMLDLIADLIDLHRMDVGQPQLKCTEAQLQSVVEESIRAVESLAAAKNIVIHNRVSPVSCIIDVVRIKRVFVNLLSNAIKFSPNGSSIEVRSMDHEESLIVEVADQGKGIAGDAMEELFRRFSPVSHSESRRDGSGLGLYVSKGLVEAHGGAISVSSEVGKGTTFSIKLPRLPSQN
jgi:PAS domain S-box-containing protein